MFCARRLSAGSPTRGIHTHERGIVIYMQLALHILVFASFTLLSFPLPPSLRLALSLTLSLSLSYSLPSSTVASCPLCLFLSPSPSLSLPIFSLRLTRCERVHPSSSFVSDLKTEGRSIGRFSSGFSSATTTPRRVEKLLSGLPIRAWKKIQVDRTHSREKDDGKEEWERGWLAGVGRRERAASGKRDGEKGESERARERARDRGKRVSPNEAWTSRIS